MSSIRPFTAGNETGHEVRGLVFVLIPALEAIRSSGLRPPSVDRKSTLQYGGTPGPATRACCLLLSAYFSFAPPIPAQFPESAKLLAGTRVAR